MTVRERVSVLREDELEEEYPFERRDVPAPSPRLSEQPYTITGFHRHSDSMRLLPEPQIRKLESIADEIRESLSGAAGAEPVTHVTIIGHADADEARERRQPEFPQFISERR